MKRSIILFLLFTSFAFSQQVSKYAPGQVIVIFKSDIFNEVKEQLFSKSLQTSNSEVNKLFATFKFEKLHNILNKNSFDSIEEESELNRAFVLYCPATTDIQIDEIISELKKSIFIEDAFPNEIGFELIDPNDTYYGSQTNLQNIKMPLAWDINKGIQDIRIAFLDSGFQPNHSEISPKIYLQKDFTDVNFSQWTGWTFDPNEDYSVIDDDATGLRTHGTEVAQVGAAATNNGAGFAGVAWNNKIETSEK